MTQKIIVQPEAIKEANDAFNWYEDRQPGLGDEFYRELDRCFEFVQEHPDFHRVFYRTIRKRKLGRFPYLVFFRADAGEINVVAIFHASRDLKSLTPRLHKH